MQTLLVLHESDVSPNKNNPNNDDYSHRQAVRAVVVDDSGQIALLKVGKQNHHKLPGGGIENGELLQQALCRELLEEIGCRVKITAEVGEVVEYRDKWKMRQTSQCFLGQKIGEQSTSTFTEEELENGADVVWALDIDNAINTLENDKPEDYDGRFIKERDLTLLKAAKQLL
jgi:ADP-ribose pyrophosphatase YjhB (NUDIX family)